MIGIGGFIFLQFIQAENRDQVQEVANHFLQILEEKEYEKLADVLDEQSYTELGYTLDEVRDKYDRIFNMIVFLMASRFKTSMLLR